MADKTVYSFLYKCDACGKFQILRYLVPTNDHSKIQITPLGCFTCSDTLLEVGCKISYDKYGYSVYDVSRGKWVLGSNSDCVTRDVFWGWVIDHDGERGKL